MELKSRDYDYSTLHIRWLIRRDMPEILDIENDVFPFAWSEDDFLAALRQRNIIGMTAELHTNAGFTVVGYMIYELHKGGIELLNLGVGRKHWRNGIGTRMVKRVIDKLSMQRRKWLQATVRETNLPAQLLFRANKLRAVEVHRDFYEDTTESAYRMVYTLNDHV